MKTKRFNKGCDFGRNIIRKSISDFGCGRSVLADNEGNIVCGHDVYRVAKDLGKNIKIVETDSETLVVVKRKDLEPNDRKTKLIQLLDNLSQEKNLEWDTDLLIKEMNEDYGFDPRSYGGYSCVVKELDLQELFKEQVQCLKKKENKEIIPSPSLFE